jgi:menaquinone-dependent protoporphyrinogen oxidase
MRVLVAYGSRFGSTREIAARIADIVRSGAAGVDFREVDERLRVDSYDAVVLGSGVYNGSWTDEATAFVRRHGHALARKPVWLFSVGSFGDRHPLIGRFIKKEPKEIGEFTEALRPQDYRVFAGVLDIGQWPLWGRLLFRALGGREGDNRRWTDIDAWAAQIASAVASRVYRSGSTSNSVILPIQTGCQVPSTYQPTSPSVGTNTPSRSA